MGLFGKKSESEPKDGLYLNDECIDPVVDDDLVELNRMGDSERRFLRVGDKTAAMIMDHHQIELRRKMREAGRYLVYDEKADRWKDFNA